MKGKILLVTGIAVGYVLGARAGRERYEQIKRGAARVWQSPQMQRGVHQAEEFVTDTAPELTQRLVDSTRKLIETLRGQTDTEAAPSGRARTAAAPSGEARTAPASSSTAARSTATRSTGSRSTGSRSTGSRSTGAGSSGASGASGSKPTGARSTGTRATSPDATGSDGASSSNEASES